MGRHGYSDGEGESWSAAMWRGQVASAIAGKRGQAFLRALVGALDAMPEKRLVKGTLESDEGVCALGCLGRSRGVDLSAFDFEDMQDNWDWSPLGSAFNIANQLAQETMYMNDDWRQLPDGTFVKGEPTPEQRWQIVRHWAARQIEVTPEELAP